MSRMVERWLRTAKAGFSVRCIKAPVSKLKPPLVATVIVLPPKIDSKKSEFT